MYVSVLYFVWDLKEKKKKEKGQETWGAPPTGLPPVNGVCVWKWNVKICMRYVCNFSLLPTNTFEEAQWNILMMFIQFTSPPSIHWTFPWLNIQMAFFGIAQVQKGANCRERSPPLPKSHHRSPCSTSQKVTHVSEQLAKALGIQHSSGNQIKDWVSIWSVLTMATIW